MLARITDNKWIYLEQISAQEEKVIDQELSVRHPRAQYMDLTDGFFDGVYHKYNKFHHRLARPLLHELEKTCDKHGLPITIIDERLPCATPRPDPDTIKPDLLSGITLDNHQVEAIKHVCMHDVGLISAKTGGGKCFGKGTRIRMFDGTIKAVEDIHTGDLLMGDDSTPRRVLSTTSGIGPLYLVIQSNGGNYVVNDEHILVLKKARSSCIEIPIKDYINRNKTFKKLHCGIKAGINYKPHHIPLDPYFLGLWLGDGRHDQPSITVNRGDDAIFTYLTKFAKRNGLVATRKADPREFADQVYMAVYRGIKAPSSYVNRSTNKLWRAIRELGLIRNKHIPHRYMINSAAVRRQLLAGFIDADGHVRRGRSVDIVHRRGPLIDDIIELARSLGLRVSVRLIRKGCKQTGFSALYTRVTISGDLSTIPTKLPYKKLYRGNPNKNPMACSVSVESIGPGEYFGFELDGNKKFLLDDCTVVHNTEMMAGVAKAFGCHTVILCDMTMVVDQIKERLELRKAAEEIGLFYAGVRPNGQKIIVGSFQSLIIPPEPQKRTNDTVVSYNKKLDAWKTRRKNARVLRDIIAKCELLLVDEADGATSKQWKLLFFHWFKGRYKYGFSGTPFDAAKPIQNLVLKEHLGSIIYHVAKDELEKINRIVPVSYTAIAFGDEAQINDKSAFDIATKEHLIDNPAFHQLISKLVAKCLAADPKHGIMILVESKPLGYALEKSIEGARFICGDHGMKYRKQVVKDFETRECRVLIGGKIAKRGLDLKGGCETLIIATGGKMFSDFNQKIGRAVRMNSRGYAVVYDFFFLCNSYLYAHSRNRLKAIVEMGYDAKVVFKNGVVDAAKFIKSRFRRPKQTR